MGGLTALATSPGIPFPHLSLPVSPGLPPPPSPWDGILSKLCGLAQLHMSPSGNLDFPCYETIPLPSHGCSWHRQGVWETMPSYVNARPVLIRGSQWDTVGPSSLYVLSWRVTSVARKKLAGPTQYVLGWEGRGKGIIRFFSNFLNWVISYIQQRT